MKIAILGRCTSTAHDCPFEDDEWEIWALAWDHPPRYTRLFEMHENWRAMEHINGDKGDVEHKAAMRAKRAPVYMFRKEPDIANSVEYPMEQVRALVGNANGSKYPYLESSIAYMMALAILEQPERIGIWGVDLHINSEYAYQKPNMEYLIGLARGRGIKVWVPANSALLKHEKNVAYGCEGYTT